MEKEIIYLTADGMKKLKEELDHMRSVERPAISAAIAEARDKGDLSENAEYDAAREAQGMLEMRIAQMEHTLSKARIIDESKIDTSKVQILSRVKLLNHNVNKEVEYTIVSENEANLREGKLAIGTPIAKALLGRKVGDTVEVSVPAGTLKLEILNISI
ncbi:transcription elongation factor GreA [Alistipes sp.]|nr:transcription elongation factor GreA [Alistipes sp.]GFI53699.1 transcription elongation factor GreA [Alistipes sp.]